jgi:GDP-4-dehydro-6-deoxy-D-mannose reductase
MSKLLVFGSGFLVRHIATHFTGLGFEIKIVYNKHPLNDFEAVSQEQQDAIDVIKLVLSFQPDFILFAVGDSYVPDNTDIEHAIHKNLLFTLLILEKLYTISAELTFMKKIIVIGSAAEYGNRTNVALSETTPLHPVSIYGLTKIFLYNTAIYYAEKGLPIIYVRQFNAIGPYQRDSFVLASFCKQVALIEKGLQKPEIEVGDLSYHRDFIDARDTAIAYHILFEKGLIGETYNIGAGTAIPIHFLLEKLLEQTSLEKDKIKILDKRKSVLDKNSLSNKLLSDNSKLTALGFVQMYSIETTITDTLNYWRNHV